MFLFFALIRGVLDVTFSVDSTEMDVNNFPDLAWQAYWEGGKGLIEFMFELKTILIWRY